MHTSTHLYPDLNHARAPTGGIARLLVPTESPRWRILHRDEETGPIENGNSEFEVVLGRVASITFPPALPVGVTYQWTSVIGDGVDARRTGKVWYIPLYSTNKCIYLIMRHMHVLHATRYPLILLTLRCTYNDTIFTKIL